MDWIELYFWNQDHFDLIPFTSWEDLADIYIRSNAVIVKDSDFASASSHTMKCLIPTDIPTEKGLYFWQQDKSGFFSWVNAEDERWCRENEAY